MYHDSTLSKSIELWPDYCSDLVSSIRRAIDSLIDFATRRAALEAKAEAKKAEDPSHTLYREGVYEELIEAQIDTSEFNHENVGLAFAYLFKNSTPAQREEIIGLPDFLLIFDSYGRSRGALLAGVTALVDFPPGRDLFLDAHQPVLKPDGSVETKPLFGPADSILSWYPSFDGALAASLWELAEEERERIRKFGHGDEVARGSYNASGTLRVYEANMDVANPYCRKRVVTALLRVRGLPQSVADSLSFEDPWGSRPSLDHLPQGLFSSKSLARYFAASNSSLMYKMAKERNIDPKVILTLLPSWEGSAESLLDSAKTLSA